MFLTRTKRCPDCRGYDFCRIGRHGWMRLLAGSRRYACRRCGRRFLVLGAAGKPLEKRKSCRFPVGERLSAKIEPAGEEIGSVQDISTGGLSVCYVADRRLPSGPFLIGLFCNGDSGCLGQLKVTTVFDRPTGATAPFSNISMRRRGLRVIGPSWRQKSILWYLCFAAHFSLV